MLKNSDCGLIVVDVQGKLARVVDNSEQMLQQISTLIQGCQALGLPIIWLEQTLDKLGHTVPELTKLLNAEQIITKTTFSGFLNQAFRTRLANENKSHWLVCGIEAHICVYQTALSLLNNRFGVSLITDAIASRNPEHKQLAIHKLAHSGAQLSNVEMVLYELLADSEHPDFRTILQLIK
ncbi:isochorismatase family protein [Pseudoalteromonas byunsanensis]|uniref:Hydrolase n=1 Tax=Pseudoalteromonas byunsanensis TaxID=327939 RepID=A0A1S1MXG5_9GAMM|nr:isochorismatase family protein [Pseudoalteromonas byunsanensis]OHU93592.1 hydrolase [Pseudoalteromonas byunsanensis]